MANGRANAPPVPWLWISGLAFESRIAMSSAGVPASATLHGLRGEALSAALQRRLDAHGNGPIVLVSFGLAGGLDPALAPGSIVIADAVLATGARHATDPAWRDALQAALPRAVSGPLLADDAPVLDVPGKRQRHLATGALAVDMESHRVAEAALARGWPLVICRVVADPAGRAVPPAALAAMDPAGDIALAPLLRSLVARPAQLAALAALARDTARARRALRGAARALARSRRDDYGAVTGAAGKAGVSSAVALPVPTADPACAPPARALPAESPVSDGSP